MVEGMGKGGEHFEDTESPAEMAQGSRENGANAETAAGSKVDFRIALGVVAENDFAGADAVGGDAGIGLETDAKVWSGASGTSAANDFCAVAQGDGCTAGAGESLSALGDDAYGRFEVDGLGLDFGVANQNVPWRGNRCCVDGAGVMTRRSHHGKRRRDAIARGWSGHGTKKFANQAIEFGVGNEMSGLLIAEGSAENAGEAQDGAASAGKAMGSIVFADQLTLNAKHRSLQFDEADVLMGEPFCHGARFCFLPVKKIETKCLCEVEKVPQMVPAVDNIIGSIADVS